MFDLVTSSLFFSFCWNLGTDNETIAHKCAHHVCTIAEVIITASFFFCFLFTVSAILHHHLFAYQRYGLNFFLLFENHCFPPL